MADLQVNDPVFAMFYRLLEDAATSEAELNSEPVQFRRRVYVRTVFAFVEGTIWIYKQTALNRCEADPDPLSRFTVGELALLQDKQFSVQNGKVQEQPKFLPVDEDFRFAVNALAHSMRSPYELDVNDKRWAWFRQSIGIRNRITHPKRHDDLIVSDDELAKLKALTLWLPNIGREIFKTMRGPNEIHRFDPQEPKG